MKKRPHQSVKRSQSGSAMCGSRSGFSLLELIVVLAVATILTSLLMPAMGKLRENVNTVVCSSNQRQIGIAVAMFADDHRDTLPTSANLTDPVNGPWRPQELMAAHQGRLAGGWDGLGLLYSKGYCTSIECFYCPSHRGDHPVERYADKWSRPGDEPIYMNYHYAGHRHWEGAGRHRLWRDVDQLVIATDGLRTASDFNHGNGMNVLHGDASVRWSNRGLEILPLLPNTDTEESGEYETIWSTIQAPAKFW